MYHDPNQSAAPAAQPKQAPAARPKQAPAAQPKQAEAHPKQAGKPKNIKQHHHHQQINMKMLLKG